MFFMNNLCKITLKRVFIHGGYQIDHVFHGLFMLSNPSKYLPTKNPFLWKAQKHGLIAPVHSIKMGKQICRLKRKIFGQLQIYVTLTNNNYPSNVCVNQHNSHQLKLKRKRNNTSTHRPTQFFPTIIEKVVFIKRWPHCPLHPCRQYGWTVAGYKWGRSATVEIWLNNEESVARGRSTMAAMDKWQ